MTATAILTNRWHSKRLPGKALALIGGKPVLQWVVDRAKQVVPNVIVATTDDSQPIVNYCYENKIDFFVSNDRFIEEEDLFLRLIQCGDYFDLDTVVRLWGDCPFIDPDLIKRGLEDFEEHNADYLYPLNLSKGLSFTIYKHKSFSKLYHMMTEGEKWCWNYVDELTPWQNKGFTIVHFDGQMERDRIPGFNINTKEDLALANKLVATYGENLSYKETV